MRNVFCCFSRREGLHVLAGAAVHVAFRAPRNVLSCLSFWAISSLDRVRDRFHRHMQASKATNRPAQITWVGRKGEPKRADKNVPQQSRFDDRFRHGGGAHAFSLSLFFSFFVTFPSLYSWAGKTNSRLVNVNHYNQRLGQTHRASRPFQITTDARSGGGCCRSGSLTVRSGWHLSLPVRPPSLPETMEVNPKKKISTTGPVRIRPPRPAASPPSHSHCCCLRLVSSASKENRLEVRASLPTRRMQPLYRRCSSVPYNPDRSCWLLLPLATHPNQASRPVPVHNVTRV